MSDDRSGGARYPDLAGRTVFVSGGAGGIGAAIVRAFAAQGSSVAFVDVDDEAAAKVASPACVRYWHCDVRDVDALRAAIGEAASAFGPIRVLVNNAARDDRIAFDDVTPDYWTNALAVNLNHHFFAAQAVAAQMADAGGGAIVNLGSVSWMRGRAGIAGYTTAKAAIHGLTRTLARELGPRNIRVNSIAPGAIATDRQRKWFTADQRQALVDAQCLKFPLVEDHVTPAVLFLASDDARAITGQTLVVDGGLAQTSAH